MTILRHRRYRLGGMVVALSIGALGQAQAQEYCVTCDQPSAVYRCVIDGARPGGSQPLQMLCITAMAKQGGHGSCRIKGGTVFDCNGPVKRVSWAAHNSAASPVPGGPAPSAPQAEPKPAAKKPPDTVVDLAKQANEQIKKSNEDAKGQGNVFGQALGTTTKKTWDCMISLFTRCGG